MRGRGAKLFGIFSIFVFQGLWRFKVKEFMKNMNFNKNETDSKTENPTHSFREINSLLQLI